MPLDRIFLVGPMGVGKTTIGRLLAERLKWHYQDLDQQIEHTAGASIPWIFDVEGESGFRERESQCLFDTSEQHKVIISTGGGVIKASANRAFLRREGYVVLLTAQADTLAKRTQKDSNRPLLQNDKSAEQTHLDLLQERMPLYREVCDLELVTDRCSPTKLTDMILENLPQCR